MITVYHTALPKGHYWSARRIVCLALIIYLLLTAIAMPVLLAEMLRGN
ncbi:MAG TPA: hypothetical protein VHB48_15670 [Chitinophagaceae bacterium]|nr:hypothetical protein [Chitinophagaceae bacterium]